MIEGAHASDVKIMSKPRPSLEEGGSTTFSIRFEPKETGRRTALIRISSGEQHVEFAIAGAGIKIEK